MGTITCMNYIDYLKYASKLFSKHPVLYCVSFVRMCSACRIKT